MGSLIVNSQWNCPTVGAEEVREQHDTIVATPPTHLMLKEEKVRAASRWKRSQIRKL